jgi:NAD(P)-dependent dehydrogenase (short-subunit alcohol dehydrogenase family)
MFLPSSWSIKDIPPQHGKTVIVTGANSGIGYFTALELGRAGAHIIVAVRDPKRGANAVETMRKLAPMAKFELMLVDISSLESVKKFAEMINSRGKAIDILINNAGIMMLPKRELSADGFELQMATNHLGHFALTFLLIPSLLKSSHKPRVVTVASVVAWFALPPRSRENIDFRKDSGYGPRKAYAESKLANLLFMRELAKRYPMIISVAAHPGGSATNLHQHAFGNVMWLMQSSESGALPSLRAAVDVNVKSGMYFGPRALMIGAPVAATLPFGARSDVGAKHMWDASEIVTSLRSTSKL